MQTASIVLVEAYDGAQVHQAEERCRLCYGGEEDGPFVQPCACGSAKLIHKACLEKWRRTSPKEDAAYRCGECKDEYRDALSLELLSARLQADEETSFILNMLALELLDQGKSTRPSRCSARCWRLTARRSATGTRVRSPQSTTSAGC